MGILRKAAGAAALAGLAMAGTAAAAPVFSVPVPKAIPGLAQHLAAGDVTGDGMPDLVALSAHGDDHDIITLAGNGDGTFRRRASTRIGAEFSNGITTVDLNDDGKLDLLVDITPPGGGGNSQVALLNDGTGRFRSAGYVSPHENSYELAVARFDGDAFPDVVSGDLAESLKFFKGLGNGTFAAPVLIRPGHPTQIIAGDLNSDGKPDLVMEEPVTSPGASAMITVSLGHGVGTFAAETTVPGQPIATAFQYFPNLAVGDINGDDKQDIVVPATSGVVAAFGHGDGTFEPFTSIGGGTRFPVITGDINNDGIDDVIFNRANRIVGILGGSFAPLNITTSPGPHSFVVADFNRDSRTDIAFMTSMATSNPKIRSSALAVTLNASNRPVIGGLVVPALVRRGAATPISFVLTEAARVSMTVSRNGKVRSVLVPGTQGTNHKIIGATKTLRVGAYVLGVRARNARGTTRMIRAVFRVR